MNVSLYIKVTLKLLTKRTKIYSKKRKTNMKYKRINTSKWISICILLCLSVGVNVHCANSAEVDAALQARIDELNGTCTTNSRMCTWTDFVTGNSATDNQWFGITYGNGLFVAVAYDGTGNGAMVAKWQ